MPKKKPAPSVVRSHLAQNLRIARASAQISQMDLALSADIARSYVSAMERKTVSAGIDVVERLARTFGVPPHVLLLSPDQAQPLIYAAKK